jgi:endoglucanase
MEKRMAASMTALAALLISAAVFLPAGSMDTAQTGPAPRYYGVNLASAEFAPHKVPGVHGQDYIYPNKATAAPFAAKGMNSIRLPILWERIQPEMMGPLDEEEMRLLDASLADLSGFKQVIIDVHNYARYQGRLLSPADPNADALPDLWRRLALRYKDRPNIAFGVMNEPHGISAKDWRTLADATTVAIRRTGARNLILIPGTIWTGAHSWEWYGDKSNATAMAGFSDPGGNFVFEIHQYLDDDSSGSKDSCVSVTIGRERLKGVTRWMREQRAQAILGEFGVPRNPLCLAALDDLMSFLGENGDVWVGWNYWAGGDWWGEYPLTVQPDKDGRERPQAAILRRHVASYARR